MPMNPADPVHQQIDQMVKSHQHFLFMKGDKQRPQCGFSAGVVGILNELGVDYDTFNILEDQEVREGVKTYADWPTFPQLYVNGELVGGADLVRSMFGTGELHKMFGVEFKEVEKPTIKITEAAEEVLLTAKESESYDDLRIEVGPQFQYGLFFSPPRDGDFVIEGEHFNILIDRGSAQRADGLVLDFSHDKRSFTVDNPNEPPKLKEASVQELQKKLEENKELRLYDVRTPEEYEKGHIKEAVRYTTEVEELLTALPKDTELWFICRSGGRSQNMGQRFIDEGFKNVTNVTGGTLAWSKEIDSSVFCE